MGSLGIVCCHIPQRFNFKVPHEGSHRVQSPSCTGNKLWDEKEAEKGKNWKSQKKQEDCIRIQDYSIILAAENLHASNSLNVPSEPSSCREQRNLHLLQMVYWQKHQPPLPGALISPMMISTPKIWGFLSSGSMEGYHSTPCKSPLWRRYHRSHSVVEWGWITLKQKTCS